MVTEIRSGLVDLDRMMGSLVPGDLMLVGGRPNSGKSAFAINMAMQCNRVHTGTVALYSNSESRERVLRRLYDYDGIRHEEAQKDRDVLTDAPASHFVRVKAPGRKGSLMICDHSAVSVPDVEDDLQFLATEDSAPLLVIIDYLHLLTFPEKNLSESLESRLSANVISLKKLAVSANVPIVLFSTVNRMPLEQRHDKRPLLIDLPMSDEAIQHTDTIILLYRNALYSQGDRQMTENLKLDLVKSKQDILGVVTTRFTVDNLRFENPLLSIV